MSKPSSPTRKPLTFAAAASDKTEAAACASSHRRGRESGQAFAFPGAPPGARVHYSFSTTPAGIYEGCAVCVFRVRVCVSARVDRYTRPCVRSRRGGKVEEKEEEDLHIVGSGGGKGGGITFMEEEGGGEERREMPKSRGLPANGKKRDGARANEREIVCARYPLHTMRGCRSCRAISVLRSSK